MRAESAIASVERSLGLLGTDYVDVIQIHWPHREIPIDETWAALEKLRSQGKARALGVSNFGARDLADVLCVGKPTTNQLPYSLLARAIEHDITPACIESGVGILCYSPLLFGLLAGTYEKADDVPAGRARSRHFAPHRKLARHRESGCENETFEALASIRAVASRLGLPMSELAVAWLLHQPGVTGVLTGIRRPSQAAANAKAADIQLDAATLAELGAITEPVKRALGSNADLWQSGESSRYR
jgi:aryl-alcohol dehydrogenase-like predicted oxidoreductase